ncbi:hypothetical protein L9F63_001310, partial [Diploptera punctata]
MNPMSTVHLKTPGKSRMINFTISLQFKPQTISLRVEFLFKHIFLTQKSIHATSIMFSVYAEKRNLIESTKEFNWKNRRIGTKITEVVLSLRILDLSFVTEFVTLSMQHHNHNS